MYEVLHQYKSHIRLINKHIMKSSNTNVTQVPRSFAYCFCHDCASADECLRYLAKDTLAEAESIVKAVNPTHADKAGAGTCDYFRRGERVRVAFGFKQALKSLPVAGMETARNDIKALMSQRTYYYLLNGEKPISPEMQEKIATILERYGLPAEMEFDRYEWCHDW